MPYLRYGGFIACTSLRNALVSGEDEKYYVYAGLQVHNFNTVQAVAEMAL